MVLEDVVADGLTELLWEQCCCCCSGAVLVVVVAAEDDVTFLAGAGTNAPDQGKTCCQGCCLLVALAVRDVGHEGTLTGVRLVEVVVAGKALKG